MWLIFWFFISAMFGIDAAENQVDKSACHASGGYVFLNQCQKDK